MLTERVSRDRRRCQDRLFNVKYRYYCLRQLSGGDIIKIKELDVCRKMDKNGDEAEI